LRTHAPAFASTGASVVQSVYSPSFDKLRIAAQKFGIANVCRAAQDVIYDKNLDLVIIASPNDTHGEYVRMCVDAHKAFLCEKPLGSSAREARRIAKLIPRNYRPWHGVNHQLRFNPYLRRMRDLVRSGEIGPPISLRISQVGTGFSDPQAAWSWSFDQAAGGGVRLAMGSHLVDLAMFLLDDGFARIDASMHPVIKSRKRGEEDVAVNVSSTFVAFGEMVSGTILELSATAAGFSGNEFAVEIFCERGELRFNLLNKLRLFRRGNTDADAIVEVDGVSEDERANRVSIFSGSFPYFAKAIVEDIEAGRSVTQDACSISEAVVTSDVLDRALTAYRRQRSVNIAAIKSDRTSF